MGISLKRILKAVLWGHLAGLGVLALLSCIAMMLPYPSKSVTVLGMLAMVLGSAFMGFHLRGQGVSIVEAVLSGVLFGLVSLFVSLFGKGEVFSFGYRLISFAVAVLLAVVPSWLFRKRKKRRRVLKR